MPENTEAVDAYNNAMDEISRHVPKHQFTPLTHQLNKSWENAPEHERCECTQVVCAIRPQSTVVGKFHTFWKNMEDEALK
jgi:hypothetical protein